MAASSSVPSERVPVAHLTFRSTVDPFVKNTYALFPSEEVNVGRQLVRKLLNVDDRRVSTHHLKFRIIVYDDGDEQVAPMIYMRVLSSNTVTLDRAGLDNLPCSIVVSNNDDFIILNSDDSIRLSQKVCVDLSSIAKPNPLGLDYTQVAESTVFSNKYCITERVLGIGSQGTVYVARRQSNNRQLACKIASMQEAADAIGLTPAEAVSQAKHEQGITLSLEKVYITPYNVYIFQDLMTGGDLMSYIQMTGALPEPQAAIIARQLFEAVKYLHTNDIAHRDIKPENILMTSWREGARVVLTDFGQARIIDESKSTANDSGINRMYTSVGTFGYNAPEIVKEAQKPLKDRSGYSTAIDIWSLGCIVVSLLTGQAGYPGGLADFEALTTTKHNEQLDVLNHGKVWQGIGHRAKDLIRGCLTMDESQRLTAEKALAMPWFTHAHYKADFDAAYKRAIQDWKPRVQSWRIIQKLDTKAVVKAAEKENQARSKYFPPPPPQLAVRHDPSTTINPSQGSLPAPSSPTDDSFASPARITETPPIQEDHRTRPGPFLDNSFADSQLMRGPPAHSQAEVSRFPEDSITDSQLFRGPPDCSQLRDTATDQERGDLRS